ncbi:hypothetical protein BKA58DRAFT_140018 [Alternaria rosae]|uniref:uncharacterized protein n=1 Tax=Alternaria rosae TaxID=1187941 RepID=UPI001E8CAAF7|nr:uncharacterized protein BKA58DRAFT_140018 [Alternaria rosae]KAH6872161.1 hypothetical protein BKA58DRAFT_140018 [Alternaria rosae]
MSKILSVALFASYAAAQTTAQVWMPGTEDMGVSYEASVVSVDNDRTILSVDVQGITLDDSMADVPATITVGGNTYYGYEAANSDYGVEVTISGACSRQNTDEAEATCTQTTIGLEAEMSSLCADPEYATDICPDGMDAALSFTAVLPEGYFNMFPVVITEGGDSLPSATAAASVSASSASVTASRSTVTSAASGSATATGSDSDAAASSGSESAASSGASATSSGPEEVATGAAYMVQVPALAGLGAAVAAFFL